MPIRIATLLATWFGCGYFPKGPGTVGSLAALGLAYVLVTFCGWSQVHLAILALVTLGPAIWAADVTAKARGLKDPGIVVIDEVVGQWITLIGVTRFTWMGWVLALALFRLFDIWKPYPVRRLERLPGGVGIVADDVLAGVYGAVILYTLGCWNLY